jgi:release factor glutamine methyltransferase
MPLSISEVEPGMDGTVSGSFPSVTASALCGGAEPMAPEPHAELRAADLLAWRRSLIKEAGGAAADLDWLLDLAGGLPWPELQALHLHPQRRVSLSVSLKRLEELWRRHRRTAEPLQYLVGRCPWRDLELRVGPEVLIPRQETEQLVELALAMAPKKRDLRWADLGTGSGAMAVALAMALPGSPGLAVDASPAALQLAATNCRAAAVTERVLLLQSDWWEALSPWWGELDLVVANPPYIPTATLHALDPVVRDHEPWLALDGGSDGLNSLRVISAGAARALAPGGRLLVEHHHDQSEAVLALFRASGLEQVEAHHDLEGVKRFASGLRPPTDGSR